MPTENDCDRSVRDAGGRGIGPQAASPARRIRVLPVVLLSPLLLMLPVPLVSAQAPVLLRAASAPVPTIEAQNARDFLDYKARLLTVLVNFKRYETTTADMEAAFGQTYPIKKDGYVSPGFIRKSVPSFRSLTFQNRIDLYYGRAEDKTIWQRRLYYEVQYYANFEQYENLERVADPSPVFYDPRTCLTLAEFKDAVTRRHTKVSALRPEENEGKFLVLADDGGFLKAGGIAVLASFKPRYYDRNSHKPLDVSKGCLTSISIS